MWIGHVQPGVGGPALSSSSLQKASWKVSLSFSYKMPGFYSPEYVSFVSIVL